MDERRRFGTQPEVPGVDIDQSLGMAWPSRKDEQFKGESKTHHPLSAPPERYEVSEFKTQSQLPATPFFGSVLLRTNFDSPAVKHWKSSSSGSSGI